MTNLAAYDSRASTEAKPYLIITADCSNPHEIDDGLFVQPLSAASELYRVGVCVAETSGLYDNSEVRKQAMANSSAKYWDLPDGEQGYDPMIPKEAIKELEFTKGKVRDALVLSFLVGDGVAPNGLEVSYGKVEVATNLTYKDFAEKSATSDYYKKFGAASTLIRVGLGYNPGGDHTKTPAKQNPEVRNVSERKWLSGARSNEAFMIAANHLLGKLMVQEARPAIYRLHNPLDMTYEDIFANNVARYSLTPGLHAGLGLDPYCRVTSPLRRLEDFMMAYQLRQRDQGRAASPNDILHLGLATRRLNQEIASQALRSSGVLTHRTSKGPQQVIGIAGKVA